MARTSAEPLLQGSAPSRFNRSDRFLQVLASANRVVFLSHVQPDPDSLGSMLGLAHLVEKRQNKRCVLTQDGGVSRAENRAMVDLIGIDLEPLSEFQFDRGDAVVMVDSQPGTGRHSCGKPENLAAVLDHHVTPGDLDGVPFVDIRPDLGATCTLVTEYLIEQRIPVSPRVATALLYGLETELSGYPRDGSPSDDRAVGQLYSLADKDLLARIRNARLPLTHFDCMARALQNALIFDQLIFTWVDPLPQPEQAAVVVDTLVRYERAEWAVCAGVCGGKLVLSVRSARANAGAGERLRLALQGIGNAGGHERRAGGCIVLSDSSPAALASLKAQLIERIRSAFQVDRAETRSFLNLASGK